MSPDELDPDASPQPYYERPSKTRMKKQSHDLQALGQALVDLPDDRLAALPAEESLIDAVREYKKTRSHEGRRRQMQYIGKLMRHTDPEPLREAVAAMQVPRAKDTLALHQAELWRDTLIADDETLTRWMAEHPESDTQQLRSLIRAARKEGALPPEQRHGRAYRELFQFIKKAMAE
ncbi:ribosome biogenesis factor YjgA [Ideonella sp. BN130291]|uniref:ribosome biogenesis factor YjgA n=1 Tax=Ideonella sp. BN130291 TaxID=3112940 RepID=UPI002E266298|nr:ribosome biogenesis factor YjgA [Ideonella sp. BN130291]